jgi:CRP/FNR family transcriptional regulator, dissimilatory nitrate respiration regulator
LQKNILNKIPIFSALNSSHIDDLSSISMAEKFKKNEFLFMEGDHYRGFFILLEGNIKIFKISSKGKEVVIHLIKPGQSFAELPIFEGKNYPVNAQALTECKVIFFPKDKFLHLLQENHDLTLKLLAGFAKRLRELTQKIEELTSKEVITRFARYLIDEIKNSGTDTLPEPFVKLNEGRNAVAGYLGTITETLSRTLKKLQEEKIIRVQGKKIFITDIKKLEYLAH